MKKSIKTLIKEQIAQELDYIKEHDQILELLKDLDGKLIDRRTLSEKRMNGFNLDKEAGMYHIKGKYSHLIGYSSHPYIDAEKFKNLDACHGSAAIERIEKLKNIDIKELERISKKIDKCFNELRFLFQDLEDKKFDSFHNPIYYNILRSIQSDAPKDHNEIQLHKFHYIRQTRK